MSDAEIGALVRSALDQEGVLATLTLRRGFDDGRGAYTATLHVYQEHADPGRPELGNVRGGTHTIGRGDDLAAALAGALKPSPP